MEQINELKWVTAASLLDNYRLHLTFNDGCNGTLDIAPEHLYENGVAA